MDIIDIKKDLNKLTSDYDSLFDETLGFVSLESKTLKEALKDQVELMIKWEIFAKSTDKLFNNAEVVIEETYADAIDKSFKSEKYKEMTLSEAKERAKLDPAYKTARRILNDVRSLRDETRGILEVVTSRKYILNNMSNAIVAGVENTIL